jgi:hypothetical protein
MDFKADEYHDPMLNDSIIKALGIATQEEIDLLTQKALQINDILTEFFADAGIILVDYKVEFGKDKDGNDLAGKFVKVGAGAYIYPFRGVLTYAEPSKIAPANSSYAMRPNVLPDEMNIVVEGDNNETTVIGRFNTRTGEMKFINNMKHTYDLKGRRVNGTNNARGAYYGKKVLMK